jgi:hypothetical protein
MPNSYRVSIRIEPITTAGVDASSGYGLTDGLELRIDEKRVLRVRLVTPHSVRGDGVEYISDTIIYLDIDVVAEGFRNAIIEALIIARRFIASVAFVYNYGFQISLAGGVPVLLLPDMTPVGNSSYLDAKSILTSFEELIPTWEQLNSLDDENTRNDLELALEWFHIGLIGSDERIKFLSYWTALEMLLRAHTPERKVLHLLPKNEQRSLIKDIKGLLANYSLYLDCDQQKRIIDAIYNADLRPPVDSWSTTLTESEVPTSSDELHPLYLIRNRLTHRGGKGKEQKEEPDPPLRIVSVIPVRDLVRSYLEKLLQSLPQ